MLSVTFTELKTSANFSRWGRWVSSLITYANERLFNACISSMRGRELTTMLPSGAEIEASFHETTR